MAGAKSLSLAVAAILALAAVAAQGGEKIPGGWQPIKDPKDAKVVEVAKFAVAEHNRHRRPHATNLLLEAVVNGQTEVVNGVNYRLLVSAVAAGGGRKFGQPRKYVTVVNVREEEKKLISFQSLIDY
ncbi:Cysteine proteinase inhibitor 5 [Striga hermonthica]|uniref:Cysteine proteinase inhibitor 5 n=1 Tax=Striga hermonthica TaxID=68872 RepID=A0A9N7N8F8_STRHE|nr:Cysteine proteinase inhibitor 5 [Striga hermonthica]